MSAIHDSQIPVLLFDPIEVNAAAPPHEIAHEARSMLEWGAWCACFDYSLGRSVQLAAGALMIVAAFSWGRQS